MFGSAIIEVAIGLVFVYLLLSLCASLVMEFVSRIFAMRSATLEDGIRSLLDDPTETRLAKQLYDHPLISQTALKDRGRSLRGRRGKPSYIPS